MLLSSPRLKAAVCFVLCSNVVSAGLIDPHLRLRADVVSTANKPVTTSSQPATASTKAGTATKGDDDNTAVETTAQTTVKTTSATEDAQETATEGSHTTSIMSSILPTGTPSSLNTTVFNTTIPAGQLPLQPKVTPAWGVGGILMLLTGVVYALVGIRNKTLHTFFSTAYLASLGTTVLVIYVMSPPISNAIQGAYLVAAVCTGLILGGVAIIFKEITEGFGCLLGGFSFGMWLLCLSEGGLVQSTGGTIIFIVAFTIGAYAFYFSHWTRHYALMTCIAFGGATVTVMGIDAFSRAGLKEFWAYIWKLNSNLFPLGTTTYPITKGIRVELAAIILIFFAGLVSQLKLWRLVQERRAKRDADRLEDEQKLAKEEENVGRQVEAVNARDREAWEATYGDGTYVAPRPPCSSSSDSGVGEMDTDEKQIARSQTTASVSRRSHPGSVVPHGEGETPVGETGSIEMADMQPTPPKAAAEIVMEQDQRDGAVMVRVAQDEYPEGPPPHEQASRRASAQNTVDDVRAVGAATSSSPNIVPLPFKVPPGGHADGDDDDDDNNNNNDDDDEMNEKQRDDRSSVATFADEDEVAAAAAVSRRTSHNPASLAKRLSQNSADLLRSISQRSKRASATLDKTSPEIVSQSQEELVLPRSSRLAFREDDDNSSLAVTMDGMSSNGDDDDDDGDEDSNDRRTVRDGETNDKANEIEVKPEQSMAGEDDPAESLKPPEKIVESRHMSAETVSTDILEVPSSSSAVEAKAEVTADASEATEIPPQSASPVPVAKSTVSVDSVVPAVLTKDRLPRSLSRVAMSYRTNEWAKHLSNADAPEFETLQLGEPQQSRKASAASGASVTTANLSAPTSPIVDDGEEAAPVNVAALQQTAETGAPAPAAPRRVSSYGMLSRSNSHQSLGSPDSATFGGASARASCMSTASAAVAGGTNNSLVNGYRSVSANQLTARTLGLHNEPILEENDAATDAGAAGGRVSMHPPVPGVVSFSAPQTLIGQREMLLRSKSQQGLYIGGPLVNSASVASLTKAGNTSSINILPGTAAVAAAAAAATMVVPSSGASDNGGDSMYNFYPGTGPAASSTPNVNIDLDDLPMNQRREMMRQSSLASLSGPFARSTPTASSVPFDSHQPKRDQAHLPTPAARQAQLASFRESVAADLRAGAASAGKVQRESLTSPYLGGGSGVAFGAGPPSPYGREHEVQQSINAQRSFLMSQKEAEAQRREMERLEKERNDRAFEERMRRGDLLEAHRDAMRRMQASAGK